MKTTNFMYLDMWAPGVSPPTIDYSGFFYVVLGVIAVIAALAIFIIINKKNNKKGKNDKK